LGGVQMRPNITGPVQNGRPGIDNHFLTQNIQIPTDPSNTSGNPCRKIGVAPAYSDFDFGLFKAFTLPCREMSLQFRSEFFNGFNNTNLTAPNGNLSNAAFGTI
jgi:hypothetical protein